MADTVQSRIAEITERLTGLRRDERRVALLHGVAKTALTAVLAALLFVVIEALFHATPAVRTVMAVLYGAGVVAALLVFAGRPLGTLLGILREETDDRTAARVGVAFPHLKDRLLNLFQLLRERDAAHGYYSLDLIDASYADLAEALRTLDLRPMINRVPLRRAARLLPAVAVITAALVALFPGSLGSAAYRLLHPGTAFTPPPPYIITVEPGNADIVRGARVELRARITGPLRHPVVFLLQPDGQAAFEERTVEPAGDGTFRLPLENIRLSTRYAVRAGPVESDRFLLRILDRPVVNTLLIGVTPPAYAGLPRRWLDENVGDVTALPGTRLDIAVEASKQLARAELVFSDSTTLSLAVNGTKAGGALLLHRARTYHVRLTDPEGVQNADPIEYTLRLLTDAPPAVAILSPGANIDVAGDEQLPMLFRLTDDYGIERLRLAHRLIHSRYEAPAADFTFIDIPLPPGGADRLVPWTWALPGLRLTPEDVVEYHAEVFDNDAVNGPKMAVSETYTLRLPSIDEVFADVDRAHEESREAMMDALKQAQEAKRELDDLAREMKKPQERLTWEEKKKAEELAQRYEEIQKKMAEVQQTVDRMMQEMQKNNTVSPETLEKYRELQQVMEQMNSPEFAEAMKRLQDAMQQVTPDAMKQALQQFQFSEEQFRKSIERTLNLLKRIQIEQKMDAVVKRTEEMRKAQEELSRRTEEQKNAGEKPGADDVQRQEDLAKQYDAMREELKELQQRMEEFPAEMPLEQMQKTQEAMDREALRELLERNAEALRQQRMQQALEGQQQASGTMQRMAQDLREMQQQMARNQQKEIVNEMRRAARDLLELSRRQEDLKNSSRGLDPGSRQLRENAQQQMELLRDLGNVTSRISALSQKTFGISPEMGKSIGDAMRQMQDALQSLDQRNGAGASQQQGGAMGSLNETAQQLQAAAQGMSQGGGQGMGMAGFLQRLQQLGGQQQGINEGSRGLSAQQAAEMARLAAEQGAVRKSLEELAREAARGGELSKLLGDLQRVARDMREVQTDLAGGNMNPETMEKQDRILSRLLDAQRSMRERDFEKRRRAEAGTNRARQSPAAIDLSTVEGRNRLQRDLLRALEEGYARDYEELIRKYFEALQQ